MLLNDDSVLFSESWNQTQMMKVLHWYLLADLPPKRLILAVWKQTISRKYPNMKNPQIQNRCEDFFGKNPGNVHASAQCPAAHKHFSCHLGAERSKTSRLWHQLWRQETH
jgi:hypothetical protein